MNALLWLVWYRWQFKKAVKKHGLTFIELEAIYKNNVYCCADSDFIYCDMLRILECEK